MSFSCKRERKCIFALQVTQNDIVKKDNCNTGARINCVKLRHD